MPGTRISSIFARSARRHPAIGAAATAAAVAVAWAAVSAGPSDTAGAAAAATREVAAKPSPGGVTTGRVAARPSPGGTVGPAPTPHSAPTPVVRPAAPAADPDDTLARLVAGLPKGPHASLSVAAYDLGTGRSVAYPASDAPTYDTASIVKVDILAALLLQRQDAGRSLTSQERAEASKMIRVSDNDSADDLWNAIGGAPGLDNANRRLGLTHTTAGSAGLWGLTQTTARDQVTLLSAVYGATSPLDADAAGYIRSLMGDTEQDQRWGVSAAGTLTGLKNGWLPRSATGLWDINSIGLVSAGGHRVLLASLSNGNTDMAGGVSLVEQASKAAVGALGL
jgi:hypothetical protein